jgi:hypothetical protein
MSVAMVGAGIAAVGAISQAQSASKAAKAQGKAADQASELSREQYEQTRADNAGFRNRGEQAGNRLQYLMGLDPGGGQPVAQTQSTSQSAYQPATIQRPASTSVGDFSIGRDIAGAVMNSGGNPALMSRDLLRSQLLTQYNGTRGSLGTNQPAYGFRNGGGGGYGGEGSLGWEDEGGRMAGGQVDETALNAEVERLMAEQAQQQAAARSAAELAASQDSEYGSLMRNFTAQDRDSDPLYAQLRPQIDSALQRSSNFETAPGYQFRLAEGQKGVENSAAARGMQLSGSSLKAVNRFNQDFASNEYGNWFNQSNTDRNFVAGQGDAAYNRFNTNNTQRYNRLAGIVGTGQTATNQVNTAGANYANNAGQNMIGAGNAQAAGIVGGANALSSGMSQGYNMYQNNELMKQIQQPGSFGWGSSGGWAGGGRTVPTYPNPEY